MPTTGFGSPDSPPRPIRGRRSGRDAGPAAAIEQPPMNHYVSGAERQSREVGMALAAVSLDDKYVLEKGRIYLTGTQALVRLPMMQRQRDLAAGLNTGGYISGYRGSPLGGLDQALWSARRFVEKNSIHFQPAINEELGATAVWGSQQL